MYYDQSWHWAGEFVGVTNDVIEYLRNDRRHALQTWDEFLANGPPPDVAMPEAIAAEMRAFKRARLHVWKWDFLEWFNARFEAIASPDGMTYGREIQGPFCGYDQVGKQTWQEVLANGPPTNIHMPEDIAESIRSFAIARKR